MPRKHAQVMEFANFTLIFGTKAKLLDLFDEVVYPAFTTPQVREYGDTSYRLHRVQLINLGTNEKPIMGITGRFIKSMVLERTQIWDDKKNDLQEDEQQMESAPSSRFLLILNSHRLVYLHETKSAPGLEAFKNTMARFIRDAYIDYINDRAHLAHEARESNPDLPRVTKKSLMEDLPMPELRVVALAGKSSLKEFIERYKILQRIRVEVLSTNNEIDNDEIFKGIRKQNKELGIGTKTFLEHRDNEGLPKDQATAQILSASKQGTYAITLSGTDADGSMLKGNNEDFNLKINIAEIPASIAAGAKFMYRKFQELIEKAILQGGQFEEDVTEKIKQIADNEIQRVDDGKH